MCAVRLVWVAMDSSGNQSNHRRYGNLRKHSNQGKQSNHSSQSNQDNEEDSQPSYFRSQKRI